MKILIIEDEEDIKLFVKKGLEAAAFVVDAAGDGEKGLRYALSNDYDLILLDMYLPKLNGMSIAGRIRQSGKTTPIIVLTVEPTLETKVQMLAFCDDYITKPFSLEELIARVRAVLRRGEVAQEDVLEVGDLRMDVSKCKVTRGGKQAKLRNKEFALLEYFMRNPSIVLSRGEILEKVWDINTDPLTNTIDVHVRYLRKKIDDGHKTKLIHTVPGRGYKIEA